MFSNESEESFGMTYKIQQNDTEYYLAEYFIHFKYVCQIEYKFYRKFNMKYMTCLSNYGTSFLV
jgi:hypothetical protein